MKSKLVILSLLLSVATIALSLIHIFAAEEGEGEQIVTSTVAVLMQKEETAKVSKYYVCGFVTNEKDAAVPTLL